MRRRNLGWAFIALSFLAVACSKKDTKTIVAPPEAGPRPASDLYVSGVAENRISIRWRDNSDTETGFKIERRTGDAAFATVDSVAANRITFDDRRVEAGQTYTYRVVAYAYKLVADPSAPVTARAVYNASPTQPAALDPPDGSVIDPASGSIRLHWLSTDADADSGDTVTYQVLFGSTFRGMQQVYAGTDTVFTVNIPPDHNAHYFWKVIASDTRNVSRPSRLFGFNTIVDRVDLPGGLFCMGQDSIPELSHPGNPVRVDAFNLDVYEVTNQQYADFLNQLLARDSLTVDGSIIRDLTGLTGKKYAVIRPQDTDSDIYFSVEDSAFAVLDGRDKFPVVQVTWYGADAYARHYGRRLPTEAEWEKAARGNWFNPSDPATYKVWETLLPDSTVVRDSVGLGFTYPWGGFSYPGDLSRANYRASGDPFETLGRVSASPVGFYADRDVRTRESLSANTGWTALPDSIFSCQVHDMSGNVWEWTDDWYTKYYRRPHRPPTEGTHKVARGGGYNEPWSSAANMNRTPVEPETGDRAIGFRTAATIR